MFCCKSYSKEHYNYLISIDDSWYVRSLFFLTLNPSDYHFIMLKLLKRPMILGQLFIYLFFFCVKIKKEGEGTRREI